MLQQSISISFSYSVKSKSQQKYRRQQCHCVTVSHVKLEEDISPTGLSISPNRAKMPYIGNQEMSDKLRNRL